jgi:ABC-type proline/glycine betaine transport system substrate-binding protein
MGGMIFENEPIFFEIWEIHPVFGKSSGRFLQIVN